jgi:hypothetical protein
MKLSRFYWIRLLLTIALIVILWRRVDWIVSLALTWVLISGEMTYFRTRAMYRFFFRHALTGTPHARNEMKKNVG